MKRQLFRSHSGFTIVELLIVIAMIGIFYAATASFSYKPQNDIERVNRMKYAISDKLRDEILRVSIGRMPTNNGKVSAKTIIKINNTGMTTTYSDSGGVVFSTWYFVSPYYDKDPLYSITGTLWLTGSSNATLTSSGWGEIHITSDGIVFSGTNITSENIILRINVSYNSRIRWIELDRRTGKISIQS